MSARTGKSKSKRNTSAAAKKVSRPKLHAKPTVKLKPKVRFKPKLKVSPKLKARLKKAGKAVKLDSLFDRLINLKSLWGLGVIAAVGTVGYGLWDSQQPPVPPTSSIMDSGAITAPAGSTQSAPATQSQAQPQTAPATQVAAGSSNQAGAMTAEFAEAATRQNIADRVNYWSHYLLKLGSQSETPGRTLAGMLGSVPQVDDTAPLIPDRFDCTTYVETVASLARSANGEDFLKNLVAIRYKDGKVGFTSRNHFPEADWVPNNERAGIIRDVTEAIAKRANVTAQVATKTIDRGKWLAEQSKTPGFARPAERELASVGGDWSTPVEAKVTYIPIAQITSVLDMLPNGAIVNLVRKPSDRHPVVIGHQGFIIRDKGTIMIRHASVSGRMQSLVLLDYLKKLQESGSGRAWPIIGINVNQIGG